MTRYLAIKIKYLEGIVNEDFNLSKFMYERNFTTWPTTGLYTSCSIFIIIAEPTTTDNLSITTYSYIG